MSKMRIAFRMQQNQLENKKEILGITNEILEF